MNVHFKRLFIGGILTLIVVTFVKTLSIADAGSSMFAESAKILEQSTSRSSQTSSASAKNQSGNQKLYNNGPQVKPQSPIQETQPVQQRVTTQHRQ